MAASRTEADATALAALIRRGDVTPVDAVEAAIARIEADNPRLNAVIHTQFQRARREARDPLPYGPLRGVPFLLKDYSAYDGGEPCCAGLLAARTTGWVAPADDEVTHRFRRAGLVVLGRTNTPELACVGTTEPVAFGPTRNPWDVTRSPGGSSGGSAAAVAAGFVPAAHATDISGSIRIPASHCGLVGVKTSARAFVSPNGPPLGFNTEGVVTRTVRDAAILTDLLRLAGPSLADAASGPPPRVRVGLCLRAFNGSDVDAGCVAAATSAAHLLESLGHHVQELEPSELYHPDLYPLAGAVFGAITARDLDLWSARLGRPLVEVDVEPNTWRVVTAGRALGASGLLDALSRLDVIATDIRGHWGRGGIDVLVTPTVAAPASVLGDYLRQYSSGKGSAFTRPFNITGQPAVSLPLGWPADGLPRGVQLVGAPGHDDLLVRLAAELEAAAPWSDRRPSLRP